MSIRVVETPASSEEQFDIIGLTREEAQILAYAVGSFHGTGGTVDVLHRIFWALDAQGIIAYNAGLSVSPTPTIERSML